MPLAFGFLGLVQLFGWGGNVIEERAVTHRVHRVNMLSPYRLVALFQYAAFIMFVRNVTNQFDTSQRVDIPFYTFFAHSPKISLSLSKLPPFDSLADISVGEFFYSV
ncbi:MAG: hypothetical protein ACLRSE_11355 [Alistipes finegoldii]